MCSACEQGITEGDALRIQQWDDQEQAWLREAILNFGWAIQAVEAEPARHQPAFAYTVGLTRYDHPELLVFGLPDRASAALLNRLGERARSGLRIGDGTLFAAGAAGPRALRVVTHPYPADVLLTAVRRYGPRVRALQVLVADENDVFPGEIGFRDEEWRQPLPGTFAA